MANIFKQNRDVNEHPNRNNFDLFYQNHLTLRPGVLTPFCVLPHVPTDSFKLNVAMGIKAMPMPFPVQSHMRAIVHWFDVRTKNIWPNFENFIEGLEEHTVPYLRQPNSFFKTGSLSDYLGIPTTLAVGESLKSHSALTRIEDTPYYNWFTAAGVPFTEYCVAARRLDNNVYVPFTSAYHDIYNYPPYNSAFDEVSQTFTTFVGFFFIKQSDIVVSIDDANTIKVLLSESFYRKIEAWLAHRGLTSVSPNWFYYNSNNNVFNASEIFFRISRNMRPVDGYVSCSVHSRNTSVLPADRVIQEFVRFVNADSHQYICFGLPLRWCFNSDFDEPIADMPDVASIDSGDFSIGFDTTYSVIKDYADINPNGYEISDMRLSALPFRAYESIYNSFYRNTQNQPFMIDGEQVFNRYNTTLEDGEDDTEYGLYLRNWELDFLTSCMPSPQQGLAPLVGITALGDVSIEDENGNVTTARYDIDGDGNFTGKLNITNPAASNENNRVLSQAAIAALGMSINDFRGVNALQRWLETNIRKGYRYKDFITGHFGKAPSNSVLDMPEFIGGYSEQIVVSQVNQTSASIENQPLGSYAGQANAFGSSRSITHYCDDYGYIIGIICIVPDPAYSQTLPKHFLQHVPLDWYFPEFAQLGMQPVTYKEVCPLQVLSRENADYLDKTFGYNRPNYDMVQRTDEVHGEFRTTYNNMVVNRVFEEIPELSDEFLHIDPKDVNRIFAYQAANSHNFIGQIICDIKAKRPLPRVHMPSLGK